MVTVTIDGIQVTVAEQATIMEAAESVGVRIPRLCFLKGINEISACRVCLVEIEGRKRLMTACNNTVEPGMVIHTNSPRVRRARRTNVQLILSQHDCRCAVCVRSGNCALQTLSNDLGCIGNPYKDHIERTPWDESFGLIRDNAKCIKCMRCIQICDKVQTLNVWDVCNTGSRTTVNVANGRSIHQAHCSLCGQCITHCPVGALRERDDTDKVLAALHDPDVITVVQVAPAVRAAWGERFGLEPGVANEKRLAAILRHMGFNYVFDTNFGADLTIMEESAEFVHRLTHPGEAPMPMFTSCCPGWMRFAKSEYPELLPHISTCKSPQQMFGAVTKSYFAQKLGVEPRRICCVSIMPCTAKKAEVTLPGMDSAGAGQDVDFALTTRELERMIRAEAIQPHRMPEGEFDMPLGEYTGAGVIFGATGGVMEAALRTAYKMVTGRNPDPDVFYKVRGMQPWKEAQFNVGGTVVRTAVVHGLGNTRTLIEAMKRGEAEYDFVEVMACPGGCVGGGGQPIHDGEEYAQRRAPVLYQLDREKPVRFSHDNAQIVRLYEEFLGQPGSALAHELLHVDHQAQG